MLVWVNAALPKKAVTVKSLVMMKAYFFTQAVHGGHTSESNLLDRGGNFLQMVNQCTKNIKCKTVRKKVRVYVLSCVLFLNSFDLHVPAVSTIGGGLIK